MSIKTPLTAFKNSITKLPIASSSDQRIANFISKTLKSSLSFDQTNFPPTSLNPKIITLVLTNTHIPPQSCINFFNSIQPHQLNLIEPYVSLSCRLYKAKDFASSKDILNQLATNDDIKQLVEKITSFVNENCSGFSKIVVGKLFDTLFRVYADNERFEESLEVFDYMKNNRFSRIDDRSCMVFLLASKRCEKFDLLSDFFCKMADSGVGITVYSMTMAVSAMCKRKTTSSSSEIDNHCPHFSPNLSSSSSEIDNPDEEHEEMEAVYMN